MSLINTQQIAKNAQESQSTCIDCTAFKILLLSITQIVKLRVAAISIIDATVRQ